MGKLRCCPNGDTSMAFPWETRVLFRSVWSCVFELHNKHTPYNRGNTWWQAGFGSRPRKGLCAAICTPGILCVWRHEQRISAKFPCGRSVYCVMSNPPPHPNPPLFFFFFFFFLSFSFSAEIIIVSESSKQLLLFPFVCAWSARLVL